MKKIFFMAVSAVLLAVGCQKTEIQNEVLPKIGFDTHMGKLTKAPNAGNAVVDGNLKEQGFMVWGHIVTEDLNYDAGEIYLGDDGDGNATAGTEVGYPVYIENGAWSTKETYYWPGKGKELDIYAVSMYAPEGAKNTYAKVSRTFTVKEEKDKPSVIDGASTTLTITDFEVEASADNDLMIAPMIRQDQHDAATIDLKFQHALTKVLLTFHTTSTEDIYVISAKTSNLKSKGTLTVVNKAPGTSTENEPKVYTVDFDYEDWSPTADVLPYEAEYVCESTVDNVVAGPKGEDDKPITSFKAHKLTGEPVVFGSWLLIPQAINEQTYIDVEYIVAGTYMKQRFNLYVDGLVEKWDVNQQTTYNIRITPDEIQFLPDVDDWTKENKPAINEGRDN